MADKTAVLINLDGTWIELEVDNFPDKMTKCKGRTYMKVAGGTTQAYYTQVLPDDSDQPEPVHLQIENLQNSIIRSEKERATLAQQMRDLIDIHAEEIIEYKDVIIHQARLMARTDSGRS